MTHRFAVMLVLDSDAPELQEAAIETALRSGNAAGFAKVRRAVLKALPHDVARVAAVFPADHAKLLMILHEHMGQRIAAVLRSEGKDVDFEEFVRPPPGYVPPGRE